MTFNVVDEVLTREMAGAARAPATRHLGVRLVRFARGVAVYEMPLRQRICDPSGRVVSGTLTTLAEAAMTAAATTTVADDHDGSPLLVELCSRFDRIVELDERAPLRAEAIVIRNDFRSVRVEAEVHCNGARAAMFDAVYARGTGNGSRLPLSEPAPVEERPLAQA